jgi:sporulation protein YqfC
MRTWKQQLKKTATNFLSLPPDTLLGASRVSCTEGKDIVVENVHTLERVDAGEVLLNIGSYKLRICGEQFEVVLVTDHEVHIHGQVSCIEYLGSDGNRR